MDPSSDYHFLNQILWRRVKLTLVCGVFEGVLQHVDPNKILILKKVKNVETGRSVPGVKMFFGHEIVNENSKLGDGSLTKLMTVNPDSYHVQQIWTLPSWDCPFSLSMLPLELLDEVEQGAVREKTSSVRDRLNMERTSVDKTQDEDLNVCEPASPDSGPPPMTLLNNLKYNPSEEEEVTYTVIDQFQQKFGAAMLHIKKQTVLSVAMAGANVCRHGKLCWLQVASNSQVYLFDIFLLGRRAFNNGLKMILEDKRILKVIHDCRWLSDCLSHQYGIMLNNVFDTQVADVLQFSMETGGFLPNCISTLQESLIRYLKVVPKHLSFLEEKQKLIQENPDVWFTRPLSPFLLKILALEATYLLRLRLVLLDEMMSDLTTLVDSYLNTYREGSADRLGGTAPTCMELPEELLQLKDFQKQRQERAAKEYSVNARGLLVRSPLQAKEPAAETTGREEQVQGLVLCKNSRTNKALSFISRQSHQDTNLLKVESMSKETTKPQHVPPQREGGWEAPHTQLHCPEPMGSEKQRAAQQDPRGGSVREAQATSLKEEIEQLLQMMEIQKGHACTKQAVAGSSLPPQVACPGSPEHSSHPTTGAELPAFPPCPALERADSWTNLSPHLS